MASMQKEQDLVKVPSEWLPVNVIDLFSSGNFKSLQSANFYTDDLKMDGETFYINKDGYLIHEDTRMSVVIGEPDVNNGQLCLVVDTSHRPVLDHKLKKLYSVVWNKMCILVLRFKESRVIDAQSIIRNVHNR